MLELTVNQHPVTRLSVPPPQRSPPGCPPLPGCSSSARTSSGQPRTYTSSPPLGSETVLHGIDGIKQELNRN